MFALLKPHTRTERRTRELWWVPASAGNRMKSIQTHSDKRPLDPHLQCSHNTGRAFSVKAWPHPPHSEIYRIVSHQPRGLAKTSKRKWDDFRESTILLRRSWRRRWPSTSHRSERQCFYVKAVCWPCFNRSGLALSWFNFAVSGSCEPGNLCYRDLDC